MFIINNNNNNNLKCHSLLRAYKSISFFITADKSVLKEQILERDRGSFDIVCLVVSWIGSTRHSNTRPMLFSTYDPHATIIYIYIYL